MSDHAIKFAAVNGLSTATNDSVTSSSKSIAIGGNTLAISVGTIAASAFPIYIMFGGPNLASTLTSTTGFRLPAGFAGRFSVPPQATHLYYLRAAASDSDISVQACDGGI